MQLFVTEKGFVEVILMKKQSEVPLALKIFAKEVGAPDAIICDAAREQISQSVRDFCYKMGTSLHVLEEGTPWANRAELYIVLSKDAVRNDPKELDFPIVFWDYCAEHRARVNNLTAHNLFQLEGRNPHFSVTGGDGNISNLCQFFWYQWCYYQEHTGNFPFPREILGRVLGPAKGEGNEMAQSILKRMEMLFLNESLALSTLLSSTVKMKSANLQSLVHAFPNVAELLFSTPNCD